MKILVVDDEELLIKGIRFNLENEGYGLKMQDATIEQVAKELYEYVLQK